MSQGDIRKFLGGSQRSQPNSHDTQPANDNPTSIKRGFREFKYPSASLPVISDSALGFTRATDTNSGLTSLDSQVLEHGACAEQDRKLASVSFSSNATTSSNQRRIKNGEIIILDSSESESDLEDVDTLLRKFRGPEPSEPDKEDTLVGVKPSKESIRVTTGRMSRRRASPDKMPKQIRRDRTKGKYALDQLITSVKKDRAAEQDLNSVLSTIGNSDTRTKALEDSVNRAGVAEKLDASMLATMIAGKHDEESVDRILHAMERTEAARDTKTWSFFKQERYSLDKRPPPPAPATLTKICGTQEEAEDAWETGFLSDLASLGGMNVTREILDWCLRTTIARQDKDVHFTYCSFILAATRKQWAFTVNWVKSMLNLVDAAPNALDLHSPITPVSTALDGVSHTRNWSGVTRVLEIIPRMFQAQEEGISPEVLRDILCILCRLAIDSEILLYRAPYLALQDAIEVLLESLPEEDGSRQSLVDEVSTHIKDVQLRLQLLAVFAGPSPAMSLFRHDLALEFFLENVADQPAANLPARLASHLDSDPQFQIRPGMNFAWLASMICIFDIALDDGNPGQNPSTEEEKQFNLSVDELAKKVKSMSSQIRDTGANHITKTEAKEALEAVHMRLLYSVRTRPRPKENAFGESVRSEHVDTSTMMNAFLKRT